MKNGADSIGGEVGVDAELSLRLGEVQAAGIQERLLQLLKGFLLGFLPFPRGILGQQGYQRLGDLRKTLDESSVEPDQSKEGFDLLRGGRRD